MSFIHGLMEIEHGFEFAAKRTEMGTVLHVTGPRWEKCVRFGTFSFVLKSGKCGNAMNGMGCTGEAGQTSKAGHILRLHHNTQQKIYVEFLPV